MFQRLLLLCLCLAHFGYAATPGIPTLGVDLPAYLSSSDLLWSWDCTKSDPLAPTSWYQGAYIGNGLLGGMVTAVVKNNSTTGLRIDMGRTDLWIKEQRQPIGYLAVIPSGTFPLTQVDMRLVLVNATLFVTFTLSNGDTINFTILVNAADPYGPTGVFCLFVSTLTGGQDPLIFSWTPDTTGNYANTTVSSGTQNGTPWGREISWWTQGGEKVNGDGGTYTTALTDYNLDCGQTLILAVASDQRTANTWSSLPTALASVAAGVGATVEGLAADNGDWWGDFWGGTSFFSFDSNASPLVTALESFTHIAGYRYASAARFTMHDLMGPWGPGGPGVKGTTYCVGPWCQFCWDMNQQVMLYLGAKDNRGRLFTRPALDMFPYYLNNSWHAVFGSNPPGGGTNILWWLANMQRYGAFHGDDGRLLTSLLPGLRSILTASGLKNGTDGLLHVEGCVSPEYPMPRSRDCSYDLAIFQWAAGTALVLALEGDPSDPAIPTYRDIVSRLAPLPIDPTTGSFEVAAGLPFAVPHRHYSHLLAAYDLDLPVPTPTLGASLDTWWNITCSGPQAHGPDFQGDDECRGFTQAAMAAMSARLNRTQGALGNLTSFLQLVGLPNGMYGEEVYAGHPDEFSPVSESAYSAAASVYGMLLGSGVEGGGGQWGGLFSTPNISWSLHVWPAAPWSNATFFRLRGQGALLVSASRVGGVTEWVTVEADLEEGGGGGGVDVPFTLFCPDWVGVSELSVTSSGGGGEINAVFSGEPGKWVIQGMKRGGGAGFAPTSGGGGGGGDGGPPDFVVREVQGRNASEFNFWGSRFVFTGELA